MMKPIHLIFLGIGLVIAGKELSVRRPDIGASVSPYVYLAAAGVGIKSISDILQSWRG